MIDLHSVGFEYRSSYYSFLVRAKEKDNLTEYHITVMNGELEKLLYGNHIIHELNGELQVETSVARTEQAELRRQIITALKGYLSTLKLPV